ncbi:hypothetical protein D918_07631 [Trichuris suis]|nr:hypothetical protein D918_07631 [Trichuris suis]
MALGPAPAPKSLASEILSSITACLWNWFSEFEFLSSELAILTKLDCSGYRLLRLGTLPVGTYLSVSL